MTKHPLFNGILAARKKKTFRGRKPYLLNYSGFSCLWLWCNTHSPDTSFEKERKPYVIPVIKKESRILRELYPEYRVTRTMIQNLKRHHYYTTKGEGNMRAITSMNHLTTEIVARIDRERKICHERTIQ